MYKHSHGYTKIVQSWAPKLIYCHHKTNKHVAAKQGFLFELFPSDFKKEQRQIQTINQD